MSKIYTLVPGFSQAYQGGGLLTVQRLSSITDGTLVTTHERVSGFPVITEIMEIAKPEDIFIINWGPHINGLIERLSERRVIYWANSLGWGIKLPPSVPVMAASRFTMGYWAEEAVGSPIYYLPNPLDGEFQNRNQDRDIDILVLERKSSKYLLRELIPKLISVGLSVRVQKEQVDSSAALFNQSKVYLYDSQEYWNNRGHSEGFGLQPLEALACGCTVFTSMNAGLSDYVDPPWFGYKIGNFNSDYDVFRIIEALKNFPLNQSVIETLCDRYRAPMILERWKAIESDLESFWNQKQSSSFNYSQPRAYGLKK